MTRRSTPHVALPSLAGLQMPAEAWFELICHYGVEALAQLLHAPLRLQARLREPEERVRAEAERQAV